MDDNLLFSLLIGIVIGSLIFVALRRPDSDGVERRAIGVASYGIGFLVTWYLYKNGAVLSDVVDLIVNRSVAILIAALAAAALFWRTRNSR